MVASTTNGDVPYTDNAGKVMQENNTEVTKTVVKSVSWNKLIKFVDY